MAMATKQQRERVAAAVSAARDELCRRLPAPALAAAVAIADRVQALGVECEAIILERLRVEPLLQEPVPMAGVAHALALWQLPECGTELVMLADRPVLIGPVGAAGLHQLTAATHRAHGPVRVTDHAPHLAATADLTVAVIGAEHDAGWLCPIAAQAGLSRLVGRLFHVGPQDIPSITAAAVTWPRLRSLLCVSGASKVRDSPGVHN